jgi:hypothetical protein
MRVLVTGARDYEDAWIIGRVLDGIENDCLLHSEPIIIIEGEAKGADSIARLWGETLDRYDATVEKYPADWNQYGKAAGPIRNKQMLVEGKPDVVVAFPKGKLEDSKGTRNMVEQAVKAGVTTYVVERYA